MFETCVSAVTPYRTNADLPHSESNQKQITLRLSVGESIHRLGCQHITADPSRLAQILLNFLSNSIKVSASFRALMTQRLLTHPSSTRPMLPAASSPSISTPTRACHH